jgi:Tfp pilus assembly protein PilP
MSGEDNTMVDQDEDLLEWVAKVRRERDERIAEIRARALEIEVKPTPDQQRRLEAQNEPRERLRARMRALLL